MSAEDVIVRLREENPEAVLWDQLKAGLVGVGRRCGEPTLAVYHRGLCVKELIATGMEADDAEEWMDQVEGASVGPHTPIILDSE